MYKLTIEEHFDAAHHLEFYDGPCKRLHGHRWLVKATWQFKDVIDIGSETGMGCDFKKLKTSLHEICKQFDHQCLDDFIYPTAENLAQLIYERLDGTATPGIIMSVQVFETPDCCVEYTNEYL